MELEQLTAPASELAEDKRAFDAIVLSSGIVEVWRDSWQELTDDERHARAKCRYKAALAMFRKLMLPTQRYKLDYREWAIHKALDLRTSSRHTAQPTGGRNWRSWGPQGIP